MSKRMDCIENRLAEIFFGDSTHREEVFKRMKKPLKPEEITSMIDGEERPILPGEESGC